MENTFLNNPTFILITMSLAAFRIYLEVIGFDFNALPLTKKMNKQVSQNFHKMGFIMSVGYVLLFAPQVLLG